MSEPTRKKFKREADARRLIVVLEDCPLETAQVGKEYVILRSDKHVQFIRKHGKDPADYRPVQLLHKMQIRAEGNSAKLLSVIKNPVTDHLPVGCRKYLTSFNTDYFRRPQNFAEDVVSDKPNEPICIVVGGIARGKIATDYTEKDVKLSNYPLSAAFTCAALTMAFANVWEVE